MREDGLYTLGHSTTRPNVADISNMYNPTSSSKFLKMRSQNESVRLGLLTLNTKVAGFLHGLGLYVCYVLKMTRRACDTYFYLVHHPFLKNDKALIHFPSTMAVFVPPNEHFQQNHTCQ